MWPFKRNLNGRCLRCQHDGFQGIPTSEIPNLQFERNLKFGELWKCRNCSTLYFVSSPGDRLYIARITPKHQHLTDYWEQNSLALPPDCVEVAEQIGGFLDVWSATVIVPCILELQDGQRFDKAILRVSKQPPYRWYPPESVFWANQVKNLFPSPFSLSLEIRRASYEKKEESMGFAPADVETLNGNSFTLHCQSDFFDQDGVKGSELKLATRPRKRKIVQPTETQAYVWVDWEDKLVEQLTKAN